MADTRPPTLLCLASYEKGADFLKELKAQGCRVILLTAEKLRDVPWPHESIDETYYMPDLYNKPDVIHAVSYLARGEHIDRIIALDEFDLEMAASLREHLRLPGMGETLTRYFRDKLAMRQKAEEGGVLVPPFSRVVNYDELRAFMGRVAPPWVLKPRTEASAIGIKKLHESEHLWRALDELGDRQSHFVLEKYVLGEVFHIDSVVSEGKVVFAEAHQYAKPPFDVMHGGGLFSSRTLPRDSLDAQAMREALDRLVQAFGMTRGVLHTEFIKGAEDGRFYFLETAARVGGANIMDMVEAASGVNLWREWAKLEVANVRGEPYSPPQSRQDYAGVLISLAKQEWPDLSGYNDPEVVWRMQKKQHAGLIVASPDPERVKDLLESYMPRFYHDFFASLPAPEKATQ